jgi:hypothetical protein
MKQKPDLSFWKLWNLSFGFFGVQIAYALQSANISRIFATLGADPHNLSYFWILPPLMGILVQPIVGTLSDKTWCRFGRRIPYLFVGATIAVLVMCLLPNAGSLGLTVSGAMLFGLIALMFLDTSINMAMQPFKMLVGDMVNEKQKAGKDAYIKIKINHITDPFMVNKLYEASQAGVDIQLVVRGNCSLITGIEGVSENIRINGIIDRYLEHSRIFVFASGGEEKVFIGSADWMPRNLNNRIEVITPVYDPVIKKEMKHIVEDGFKDTMQGRIVDGSGKNLFREEETPFRSQEALYNHYLNENI